MFDINPDRSRSIQKKETVPENGDDHAELFWSLSQKRTKKRTKNQFDGCCSGVCQKLFWSFDVLEFVPPKKREKRTKKRTKNEFDGCFLEFAENCSGVCQNLFWSLPKTIKLQNNFGQTPEQPSKCSFLCSFSSFVLEFAYNCSGV